MADGAVEIITGRERRRRCAEDGSGRLGLGRVGRWGLQGMPLRLRRWLGGASGCAFQLTFGRRSSYINVLDRCDEVVS